MDLSLNRSTAANQDFQHQPPYNRALDLPLDLTVRKRHSETSNEHTSQKVGFFSYKIYLIYH